jgi:hypothetical protein
MNIFTDMCHAIHEASKIYMTPKRWWNVHNGECTEKLCLNASTLGPGEQNAVSSLPVVGLQQLENSCETVGTLSWPAGSYLIIFI